MTKPPMKVLAIRVPAQAYRRLRKRTSVWLRRVLLLALEREGK